MCPRGEIPPMPRPLDDPTPDAVLDEMTACEPYTALDLAEHFNQPEKRRKFQRRLQRLHDDEKIQKKDHAGDSNRVSWWRKP